MRICIKQGEGLNVKQYNDKFLSFIKFGITSSGCLDDFLQGNSLIISWQICLKLREYSFLPDKSGESMECSAF